MLSNHYIDFIGQIAHSLATHTHNDPVIRQVLTEIEIFIMQEEDDSDKRQHSRPSSPGLRQLLERHGVTPTGDADEDLDLARAVMPKGYR